jgi:murein peptide amidase A
LWGRAVLVLRKVGRVLASKQCVIGGGTCLAAIVIAYLVFCFWPRTVAFAFDTSTCVTNPVLLPGLVSKKTSPSYQAAPKPSLSIAGLALYSHTTCITAKQAPKSKAAEVIIYGNLFVKKRIRVTAGVLPAVQRSAHFNKPIPVKDALVFELTQADAVFGYRLMVGDKQLACAVRQRAVHCDLPKLQLAQAATYQFTLERMFSGRPAGVAFQQTVTTVEAVRVAASSIGGGQTVYDQPGELTLTLNKPATTIEELRLEIITGDTRQEVPVTSAVNGSTITVRFAQPLARSSSFELSLGEITAGDGGYLAEPFKLGFATSGGPKARSVTIGTSKVQPGSSVVISFDSSILTAQPLGDFIRLEIGGKAVAASVTVAGNRATIKPASALPACARFTVVVRDGLKNEFGVSGGSAWQFKSRVLCQTVFSIGTSVQGRGITGYRFGSGASKMIFVGGTHGDEKSSVHILNDWVNHLEANPDRIPAHRTLIIIPNLNPDGYAMSRRTNANNVDLNRNFPANNWKQGVTMPGGSFNPNGGGSAPLSEPESRALADYVTSQNPRLVLTYHSAAGVVIPNDSGDSDALARLYDQKSNVNYASNSQTGSIFNYDTTGAFEDWLHDKRGIAALLIELWTKSGSEFSKNQNALWAMTELP